MSLFGFQLPMPGAGDEIDETTLRRIAEATGGRFFRARDTAELAGIYAEIDRLEPVDLGIDAGQLGGVSCPEEASAGRLGDAAQRRFVDLVAGAGHRQLEAEQRHRSLAAERDRVDAHTRVGREFGRLQRIKQPGTPLPPRIVKFILADAGSCAPPPKRERPNTAARS